MRPLALAALLVLAIAAPAAADDPPTVAITLKDRQFVPSEVPVPAGVKVRVTVRNEQPTTSEFESSTMHFEKIVNAGAEITIFIGPLKPGTYEFFDDFHHETRGHMVVQ